MAWQVISFHLVSSSLCLILSVFIHKHLLSTYKSRLCAVIKNTKKNKLIPYPEGETHMHTNFKNAIKKERIVIKQLPPARDDAAFLKWPR